VKGLILRRSYLE
jgi:hypothetical protein